MGLDSKTKQPIALTGAQEKIFEVFKLVKKYLDGASLPYFLLGGSLLGAVRHKGFIPWDDDIDIGLCREDYERFIQDISANLPEYLELRTFRDESDHHYYFSRIVDNRYLMKREGSLETRYENVWVDVFPLDGMPNGAIARRIHMLRLMWVRVCYHVACFDKINLKRPHRPLSERLVIALIQLLHFKGHKDYRTPLEKLDKLLKRYSVKNTNWVVNFMGQYKFKEMFPKSYYGKGKLYPFEDLELMGPEDYNKVLSQMYGDYMKEPEDCDKNVHAAELVKDEPHE
jgi:lipopolysaccharide cholinephosphotransferase